MVTVDYKGLIEKQLMIKYYLIKHLILLKIRNMMGINVDLFPWFRNILIKRLMVEQLKMTLHPIRIS